MSSSLLTLLFIVAFLLIALNLVLTLKLVNAIRFLTPAEKTKPLPEGVSLPSFKAKVLQSNQPFSQHCLDEQARVLLFLSPVCPKCREKLPEIDLLLEDARQMGVAILLISDEKARKMKRFLKGTSLAAATLLVDKDTMKMVNPISASPYYLFLDQENTLQAQGFVGDDNWLGFVEQIKHADMGDAA